MEKKYTDEKVDGYWRSLHQLRVAFNVVIRTFSCGETFVMYDYKQGNSLRSGGAPWCGETPERFYASFTKLNIDSLKNEINSCVSTFNALHDANPEFSKTKEQVYHKFMVLGSWLHRSMVEDEDPVKFKAPYGELSKYQYHRYNKPDEHAVFY